MLRDYDMPGRYLALAGKHVTGILQTSSTSITMIHFYQYYCFYAGMKDIDAIVERFMEAEDANFSLFNYVNEVNAEVEKLEEQIADIKVKSVFTTCIF